MRAATLTALLCLAAAGCAGIEPGRPPVAGANEMGPGPGVFSGEDGDFLILGSDPVAAEDGSED